MFIFDNSFFGMDLNGDGKTDAEDDLFGFMLWDDDEKEGKKTNGILGSIFGDEEEDDLFT